MNEQDQIERMAKTIRAKTGSACALNCTTCSKCMAWRHAEILHSAGCRLQIESEWIFHPDGSATCKQCGTTQKGVWDFDNCQNFCGHCGAKNEGSLL